ncbi:hypothetical protein, partial [Vibrio cholerae]|uniref:hypothetical protein n=1 Tax=Vibrio cholerae TaxID=666 RepID=UPI003D32CD93
LGELVHRELGVTLDKGAVRTSDWSVPVLSDEQVNYAVGDVKHLPDLYEILIGRVRSAALEGVYRSICEYMPVDAHLEVAGVPNPLQY